MKKILVCFTLAGAIGNNVFVMLRQRGWDDMKEKLARSTSINTRVTWAERNKLAAVAPDGLSEAVRQAIKLFIQCQEQNHQSQA